jgi:shikimate dehydrogenase
MHIEEAELPFFFPLAHTLGFKGLSVTMPLKEKVLPFVYRSDAVVTEAKATNTLVLLEGKIFATNVDGVGAIDAIEKHILIKNKKIVILGAGGSAAAIAHEAKKRGATVHIANRTEDRVKNLALRIGCTFSNLDTFPSNYDILINATSHPMPINKNQIIPYSYTMDITYKPRETLFLEEAKKLNCKIIYGEEMFVMQAEKQNSLWDNQEMQSIS